MEIPYISTNKMESVTMLSNHNAIPPALPPKTKPRTSLLPKENGFETIRPDGLECGNPATDAVALTGSKAVSASTSSSYGASRSSTVFLAGDQQPAAPHSVGNAPRTGHVVTIRINPDAYQHNAGFQDEHHSIILNSEERTTFKSNTTVNLNQTSPINTIGKFIVNICENSDLEPKLEDVYLNSKNITTNGSVRISVGSTDIKHQLERSNEEMVQKSETIMKTATSGNMNNAYFFCNAFPCSPTNMISSGQCSPSDTLDSGTCSDLDGTPPPLPKKKNSKSNGTCHKRVSVTVIGATTHTRAPSVTSSGAEVDSEDSESNISCDSLNSSELSTASLHEESAAVTFKSEILKAAILNSERRKSDSIDQVDNVIPAAPTMPIFLSDSQNSGGFLPQGLLQDIRDRSAKLSSVTIQENLNVNKTSWADLENKSEPIQYKREILIKPEEKLTSFKLVSQVNNENKKPRVTDVIFSQNVTQESSMSFPKILPIINESTYEDRKLQQDKQKQDQLYSSNFLYDTDKYYNFHLNENVFDNDSETEKKAKKKDDVNGKSMCNVSSDSEFYDEESMEYFAGLKDYKNEDTPSTIKSAKGTIRGVKNRVRAGIATFLQMQNTTTKSYKEKDAGKVVLYSTSMGIVRGTYQKCILVKKILRNLLIKFEERDVFMSGDYQEEIKDRMNSSDVLVPQLYVEGQHIGDADTVERLNEAGELRRMLKPYKSADACTTCQMCGGFRLLPCQVCSGSKKSVHRNHFTAEFVALKCMNCDEVGLVKCDVC